jgi:gamma-glutamyl phosphate reductase
MEPINLTKMLSSEQEFQEEYLRVTNSMNITPVLDQAIELFNGWKTVRVPT